MSFVFVVALFALLWVTICGPLVTELIESQRTLRALGRPVVHVEKPWRLPPPPWPFPNSRFGRRSAASTPEGEPAEKPTGERDTAARVAAPIWAVVAWLSGQRFGRRPR